MHPVIHECPICQATLTVTSLHCNNCDTTIDGSFTLGRFHHLTPEQIHFAETFILCEGKINRVEDELGVSYPTVRARLYDLIKTMGYEVRDEELPAAKKIDRQAILADLADGKINADEAAQRLTGK